MSTRATLAREAAETFTDTTLHLNTSLGSLQTEEQRQVLDTVAQVRKCGLETILSLPQLVVCGDQSAGKSSVLEALTEIPFERNDNLCTRYATEIILRRAPTNSLTIKVIPDTTRPAAEQATIRAFKECIQDFNELPRIMEKAMTVMGLNANPVPESQVRAFAKDVLSIEIEGPTSPQLTLVDIPGLIQTATKGVSAADVDLVAEITQQYISQPRTICLAVVSATNDYANQKILTKVREVDPEGNRTLGIITKPDLIPKGSGSEQAFLQLAKNQDIFFKLGWHVLRNRKFEEGTFSLQQRNAAEATFFNTSNFKTLPKDTVGIESLRARLSALLFEHIKKELPNLQNDLNNAMTDTQTQLSLMGESRKTPIECRSYLSNLSLDVYEVCKAAVEGHYEGGYFTQEVDSQFSVTSTPTIRRLRAVVQFMNQDFAETLRLKGHKYDIQRTDYKASYVASFSTTETDPDCSSESEELPWPEIMIEPAAIEWVSQVLLRTRGKELIGNFNPLLIGELFWEQSAKWHQLALDHLTAVAKVCRLFLKTLFLDKCPEDIRSRVWISVVDEALQARSEAATQELEKITDDLRSHPINYNQYYTDTVQKKRKERDGKHLETCISNATRRTDLDSSPTHEVANFDVNKLVESWSERTEADMNKYSCEEALDGLSAIYLVLMKAFTANVTIQVVERHIVRGLERIFSPVTVSSMSDERASRLASEPAAARRQREFLEDRKSKLKEGQSILRKIM